MRRTLERIVAKFDADRGEIIPEPTKTLELTGPGIFTDALDGLLQERSEAELGIRYVSRIEGLRYFRHVAQGSWKSYLGAAELQGLKPHERTLRGAVLLVWVAFLLGVWFCRRGRETWREWWREFWHESL